MGMAHGRCALHHARQRSETFSRPISPMLTRTICNRCSVGCGLVLRPRGDGTVEIEGDRLHPANRGELCAQGLALPVAPALEGRLLRPHIGNGPVSWDRALAHVARRLTETLAQHGPESIAMRLSDGMLTEDFYTVNKLMKGFIGSANIGLSDGDGASPGVTAHRQSFGEDIVAASRDDVSLAELVLSIDADTATHAPILHRHLLDSRRTNAGRLVVIDAGDSPTATDADLHLAPRAGSTSTLMRGLLAYCLQAGAVDRDLADAPDDFWTTIDAGHDLWSIARTCDLPPADVQRFYEMVVTTPRIVTLFSAQSMAAQDILNFHVATGRIGQRGNGPLILSFSSNAMGAREAGASPETLAAHHSLSPDGGAVVQRLWGAPTMAANPGLTRSDLLAALRQASLKAIWIMGDAFADEALVEALEGCPLVIVSGTRIDRPLARRAHVLLPAGLWGEQDGTMTGLDRMISRQRPFRPAPGEARADWWMVTQVARRMGWADAFYYDRPAEIYREHCRLSAYRNDGRRLFDLTRHVSISNPAYDAMMPWRWGGDVFADGHFPTSTGRARLTRT